MKSFRSRARRSDPAPDQLVRLFQSETAEILESPEPFGVRATVYVLAGFMVALLLVAVFVRLDRVVYSTGQIVTTQPTLVIQALERCGWNQTRAAGLLGLNRDQIRYRIEKFKLERPAVS